MLQAWTMVADASPRKVAARGRGTDNHFSTSCLLGVPDTCPFSLQLCRGGSKLGKRGRCMHRQCMGVVKDLETVSGLGAFLWMHVATQIAQGQTFECKAPNGLSSSDNLVGVTGICTDCQWMSTNASSLLCALLCF